jgi:hypothetical protein
MANGNSDILPLQPFSIKVLHTSTRDHVILKGMVSGHALPHPNGIIALTGEESPAVTERPDVDGELWKEELDLAHLLTQQRETVFQLLAKHRKMWDGRLGRVNATTHRIDLVPGAKPVHSQPYRPGPRASEAESAEVQRMLKAGVIEPASSEWASPVVLAKPDETLRFCVDYLKLSAVTTRDTYPLPRMYECIDSLGDAQIFTTLDCNSGYWQVPVAPEDIENATFTSHEGTFQFNRMPFELRNAPATFQRTVDIFLSWLR